MWNWQQTDWPNWRFDTRALEEIERRFLLDAGRLQGAWVHLAQNDQQHLKIELLSNEAIKTSEIEGKFLSHLILASEGQDRSL